MLKVPRSTLELTMYCLIPVMVPSVVQSPEPPEVEADHFHCHEKLEAVALPEVCQDLLPLKLWAEASPVVQRTAMEQLVSKVTPEKDLRPAAAVPEQVGSAS